MSTAKHIAFKNGAVHYTVGGRGRTVVLIHGFLENQSMWETYAERLSTRYKVICPDLPGHGATDCFGYVHPMELMAESVKACMDAEKVRKAILVGHSMGGYVAMAFADLFPDHIKGLCLFQSTSRADSPERKKGRDGAIKLVKQNHKSFIRKAIPQLFRYSFRQQNRMLINQVKQEALTTPKQGVIAALEGMKRRPSREIIFKFPPYPVMLLGGFYDQLISRETLKEQAQHSDKVSVSLIKEAGHMAYLEAKEEAFTALKKWISKC